LSETLWLRALAEARERLRILARPEAGLTGALAAFEQKIAELTAALAEARAEISRKESELLAAIQERLSQSEQIRSLTGLLTAEQQLRVTAQGQSDTQARELNDRRAELIALARRRLARYSERVRAPIPAKKKGARRLAKPPKPREKSPIAKRSAKPRTRLKRRGHR
jgi:chromosome segregation ATPase